MRDMLEDAQIHRDDAYGRAQQHAKQHLPKRFYTETGVKLVDGGFAVTLDGKPTKTPGKVPVVVPVAGIATIMAEQWAAQGKEIDAETMPMVRLINSALEGGEAAIPAYRDEIIKFAGNDLLLYRVDSPKELVEDHEALWDGALVALTRHFDVAFQPTIGIIHQPQPAVTLAKLAESLQDEGLFVLISLVNITALTGSGLLAIGLWNKLFTPDHVWTVAHVDEDFQIRLWGEDDEAVIRRNKRRIEFDTAVKVLELMRA